MPFTIHIKGWLNGRHIIGTVQAYAFYLFRHECLTILQLKAYTLIWSVQRIFVYLFGIQDVMICAYETLCKHVLQDFLSNCVNITQFHIFLLQFIWYFHRKNLVKKFETLEIYKTYTGCFLESVFYNYSLPSSKRSL